MIPIPATLYVLIALRDNPYQPEIGSVILYTCMAFVCVFCDIKGRWARKVTPGFSLAEKAVRRKLPLLACIHAGFLSVLFAAVAEAMRLRPHTWFRWHLDPETFDTIVFFLCSALAWVQIRLSRRILERAVKDEHSTGNS